jgi:hypothetical protein
MHTIAKVDVRLFNLASYTGHPWTETGDKLSNVVSCRGVHVLSSDHLPTLPDGYKPAIPDRALAKRPNNTARTVINIPDTIKKLLAIFERGEHPSPYIAIHQQGGGHSSMAKGRELVSEMNRVQSPSPVHQPSSLGTQPRLCTRLLPSKHKASRYASFKGVRNIFQPRR